MIDPTSDFDELDEEGAFDEFNGFVAAIVSSVVRGTSLADLYALAEDMASGLTRAFPDAPDDPVELRATARMLARHLADQTPQPEHGFALRTRPRPGRNDPCDCGSGRKYKQCCQRFERQLPMERMNLLPYVLATMPRKRWAELVGSAVDPMAVADAAQLMLENGEATGASALLEPWFKTDATIPARHEPLLDTLLDTYMALDQPRKKQRLLQQALARGDRAIRSCAHQSLATITADEGNFAAAWEHFRAAQREDADSASLAHLEIVLLIAQGEQAQARERARFWIARLQRLDDIAHAGIIGFLQEVVAHGERALLDLQGAGWPELPALLDLLAAAPAPASHHVLRHGSADDAGVLAPDRELTRALKTWAREFPQIGPALTGLVVDMHPAWEDPARWLRCLREQPLLWQSLDVLDDLVLALSSVNRMGMTPLLEGLFERAQALLQLALADHSGKTLKWEHMENRPALRLLAQHITAAPQPPGEDTLARMAWILALNPDDNHGYRGELAAAWLLRDDAAHALALTERYPQDSELSFVRALALYALDRGGEALQELAAAHARLPRIAPMLAAANPRKPPGHPDWITYGGADQAWQHREAYLPAWRHCEGALPWLRSALRGLKRAPAAP